MKQPKQPNEWWQLLLNDLNSFAIKSEHENFIKDEKANSSYKLIKQASKIGINLTGTPKDKTLGNQIESFISQMQDNIPQIDSKHKAASKNLCLIYLNHLERYESVHKEFDSTRKSLARTFAGINLDFIFEKMKNTTIPALKKEIENDGNPLNKIGFLIGEKEKNKEYLVTVSQKLSDKKFSPDVDQINIALNDQKAQGSLKSIRGNFFTKIFPKKNSDIKKIVDERIDRLDTEIKENKLELTNLKMKSYVDRINNNIGNKNLTGILITEDKTLELNTEELFKLYDKFKNTQDTDSLKLREERGFSSFFCRSYGNTKTYQTTLSAIKRALIDKVDKDTDNETINKIKSIVSNHHGRFWRFGDTQSTQLFNAKLSKLGKVILSPETIKHLNAHSR